MMQRRSLLLALGLTGLAPWANARDARAPALMLAEVYRPGMPLADYWVSEKYDGVRGYWDGQQLWTRGGERIAAWRAIRRSRRRSAGSHGADSRHGAGGESGT